MFIRAGVFIRIYVVILRKVLLNFHTVVTSLKNCLGRMVFRKT